MNEKIKKIDRAIKIRKWILSISIAIGFGLMGLDLFITKNFFKHNEILMLISILAMGFAIFVDSTIKRLKADKKRLENEYSGN